MQRKMAISVGPRNPRPYYGYRRSRHQRNRNQPTNSSTEKSTRYQLMALAHLPFLPMLMFHLFHSYQLVASWLAASRLLSGNFVGGQMVQWRDDHNSQTLTNENNVDGKLTRSCTFIVLARLIDFYLLASFVRKTSSQCLKQRFERFFKSFLRRSF